MASNDSTRTTTAPDNESYYSTLPPLRRIDAVLEMATEIRETQSQHFALSAAIATTLAPPEPGADSTDWQAYRLAQLLEDAMADNAQMGRLIECLTASRDALVQEGGAAAIDWLQAAHDLCVNLQPFFDLSEQEIAHHNNTDFDNIEFLLKGAKGMLFSFSELVEGGAA